MIAPAAARADNAPAVDKLIQMNKKALEDYDAQDWDSAKRTLLQALVFAKKSGLETHPMMARTYVHLGAVYVTGFKDRAKGLQSFGRALEIDANIHLSRAMSTPELEGVFADAHGAAGGGKPSVRASGGDEAAPPPAGKKRKGPIMESDSADTSPPADEAPKSRKRAPPPEDDESAEPDLPARINALECPVKDETPPDKPVLVRCAVAKNLSKVASVVLYYLEPGKDDFTEATMEKSPKGWFTAKIPKKAVTGTSLRFYIEGHTAEGKPIVANGSKDSPNLMLIREAEAEKAEEEMTGGKKTKPGEEEENPLDEPDPTRPRRLLGKVDKSKLGVDTRYGNRSLWIGIALGSGFGYARSGGLEARTDFNTAFGGGPAWAGYGHLALELGYQLGPDFALSIEGRDQYIYQSGHYSRFAATGAHAALLRFLAYTKQQRTRFFFSIAAGGGEGFRLVVGVPAGNDPNSADTSFKDTVRGGPYLGGGGVGVTYEISKGLTWVAEVNLLAGFPKFAIVADLNTGFQINFEMQKSKPAEPERELRSVRKPTGGQESDDE